MADSTSLLRRIARQGGSRPALTPARALRLATTRAAEHSIGLHLAVLGVAEEEGTLDDLLSRFEAGLLDLRRREGLYSEKPGGVHITDGVLYRAVIEIPSQVPVGTYTAETFLIDDGKVLAVATRKIEIGKTGFERFVALASRRNAALYGLAAVLLSLGLGWGATALFRRRF